MRFHGPGMMFLGLAHLVCFGLLVAAIAFAIWLVARKRKGGEPGRHHLHHPGHPFDPGPPQGSSAQQILDERLAQGDIEIDDYLSRRAALAGERPNGTEYRAAPAPEAPEDPTANI